MLTYVNKVYLHTAESYSEGQRIIEKTVKQLEGLKNNKSKIMIKKGTS